MQQGFYPDPPSRRLAYDVDSTIVVRITPSNTLIQLNSAEMQYLNCEDERGTVSGNTTWQSRSASGYFVFIFPELRDIDHVYSTMGDSGFNANYTANVEWSTDTTSGLDGTWTSSGSFTAKSNGTPVNPAFRYPLTMSIGAIKAIRFSYVAQEDNLGSSPTVGRIHMYGKKTAGETPHRMDFVYSDSSELGQDFDYGDQPRDTSYTWNTSETFNLVSALYLRNRSPDKIASDVHLTVHGLSTGMTDDILLSKDNTSYVTQLSWVTIDPLSVVGPIYVRHTTADTETLGVRIARLQIAVGSWV